MVIEVRQSNISINCEQRPPLSSKQKRKKRKIYNLVLSLLVNSSNVLTNIPKIKEELVVRSFRSNRSVARALASELRTERREREKFFYRKEPYLYLQRPECVCGISSRLPWLRILIFNQSYLALQIEIAAPPARLSGVIPLPEINSRVGLPEVRTESRS